MEKNQKTPAIFWKEFKPLWLEEVKKILGWTDWFHLMIKTGLPTLAVILVFFFGGSQEEFIYSAMVMFVTGALVFLSLQTIALIAYHRASEKLYNNQIEKRKELGEFIDNPFRIDIHPTSSERRERPLRRSLEIHNKMQNQKIEECYVNLDVVYDTKNKLAPKRINQNLMWNAREREENQLKKLSIPGNGWVVCDVAKEEGPTTAFYLTWISDKRKEAIEPGEWILCFKVFGDWNGYSTGFDYHCTMIVESNYEVLLKNMREGKYEPSR